MILTPDVQQLRDNGSIFTLDNGLSEYSENITLNIFTINILKGCK